MAPRMRAKLLLATALRDIGDEEDVIVVRRGSIGQQCYSTLDNAQTVILMSDVARTICESAIVGKADA